MHRLTDWSKTIKLPMNFFLHEDGLSVLKKHLKLKFLGGFVFVVVAPI